MKVYAIAELVRRQKENGCYNGIFKSKTRNSQVGLYQSGDVDFLITTDAIGMGLNMDISKFIFQISKNLMEKKLED